MKKMMLLLLFAILVDFSYAQNMDAFFQNQGKSDVGSCAHLSNTFYSGTYDIEPDFITVDVYYTDKNLDNNPVHTTVKLGRGFGSLYFNSIEATYDNDYVNPFVAFGSTCLFITQLAQKVNPQKYDEIKQDMIQLLGTNPENWNGADWALFAMNVDYFNYTAQQGN